MTTYTINAGTKQIVKLLKSCDNDFIVLGIAGGSASGKGFLTQQVSKVLDIATISMDDYYKGTNDPNTNFDHPHALDLKLLAKHLIELQQGSTINKPIYDFATHSRSGYEQFSPKRIIILDGLFSLNKLFLDTLYLSIFVDAPEETRFKRRMIRDINQRGRTEDCITKQWDTTVQPMYLEHIEPQREFADILIMNS